MMHLDTNYFLFNFLLIMLMTILLTENLCVNDIGGDIGMCGAFGTCQFEISESDDSISSYYCSCNDGYKVNDHSKCVGKIFW